MIGVYRGGPDTPRPGERFVVRGQDYVAVATTLDSRAGEICERCAFKNWKTCSGIGIPACGPVYFKKTVDAITNKLSGQTS